MKNTILFLILTSFCPVFSQDVISYSDNGKKNDFVADYQINLAIFSPIIIENLEISEIEKKYIEKNIQDLWVHILQNNHKKYGYKYQGIEKDSSKITLKTLYLKIKIIGNKKIYNSKDTISNINMEVILVDGHNFKYLSNHKNRTTNFPLQKYQKQFSQRNTLVENMLQNILPMCSPKLHKKELIINKKDTNVIGHLNIKGILFSATPTNHYPPQENYNGTYQNLFFFMHNNFIFTQKKVKNFDYWCQSLNKKDKNGVSQATCYLRLRVEKDKQNYKIIFVVGGTLGNQSQKYGNFYNPAPFVKDGITKLVDAERINKGDYLEFIYTMQEFIEQMSQ